MSVRIVAAKGRPFDSQLFRINYHGQRWTVQKLADCADMSRSAFALRFKDKVRMAVMEYLTRWRMLLAGDQLRNSNNSVSDIALSLGYEWESAFGFASKREMGCSPRQYCPARSSTLDDSNALG
jgi:AraC-like DNA-binding protein